MFNLKNNKQYSDIYGNNHSNAVVVCDNININFKMKEIEVVLSFYSSPENITKEPLFRKSINIKKEDIISNATYLLNIQSKIETFIKNNLEEYDLLDWQ